MAVVVVVLLIEMQIRQERVELAAVATAQNTILALQ
jgi:hypothetical protein